METGGGFARDLDRRLVIQDYVHEDADWHLGDRLNRIDRTADLRRLVHRLTAATVVLGAVAWAVSYCLLGYFLGQVSFIKNNLEVTLLAIVFLSIVPIIIEVIKARKEKKSLLQEEADDITQVMEAHVHQDDSTQIIPRVER